MNKIMSRILCISALIILSCGFTFVPAHSVNADSTTRALIASHLFKISLDQIDDPSLGVNYNYNIFGNNPSEIADDAPGYVGGHSGIDFQTKDVAGDLTADRTFYSVSKGTVVRAGDGDYHTISIYDADKDISVLYLHARSINSNVFNGASINVGDPLGIQGDIGPGVTGEHVHLEVRSGSQTSGSNGALSSLNPEIYVPQYFNNSSSQVDVFMLVDLSGSFSDDLPVFKTQAPGLMTDLKASNPDIRFGLGKFEDYPISPFGEASLGDKAYEKLIDLTSNTDDVLNVIQSLYTRSGNDTPQSQLVALYQAATGAGQDLSGAGYPEASIPAGQNASFRNGAKKIFILWTDAPFHHPGDPGTIPYPGPSWDSTIGAINALDPPMVIGISSGSDGVADLQAMALATGAIAPPEGIDLDNDGVIDIPGGGPLVATIGTSGQGIGEAIVKLLEGAVKLPSADAGGPYEGNAQEMVTFDGSGSFDPDGSIAQYEWDFESDGIFDFSSESPITTHSYLTEFSGNVTLKVTDNDGGTGTDIASVTIISANRPPIADAGDLYSGSEGSPVTLNASDSHDPDGSISLYEWDFDGDGTFDASSSSPQIQHTWPDDFDSNVNLRVTDNDGLISIATAQVTINNVAPVVEAGPNQINSLGNAVAVNSTFTEQGTLDTHTALIDWGDGKTDVGLVSGTNTSGLVAGSHQYLVSGDYLVTVKVTDKDGGVGQDSLTIGGWSYIFKDLLKGTKLNVNENSKTFQFISPDKEYPIKTATRIKVIDLSKEAGVKYDSVSRKWKLDSTKCGLDDDTRSLISQYRSDDKPTRVIQIIHKDNELLLNAVIIDAKVDICFAVARDLTNKKVYFLIDDGQQNWTYDFRDENTSVELLLNTPNKLFQVITPDKQFSLKLTPTMKIIYPSTPNILIYDFKNTTWKLDTKKLNLDSRLKSLADQMVFTEKPKKIILVSYQDKELQLSALVVDGTSDYCLACAKDIKTEKLYQLTIKP
jgi:hypothetical protein